MRPDQDQLRREISLPPELQRAIARMLLEQGMPLDLEAPTSETVKKLAAAVIRLSDFYIQHPDRPTPWQEPWAKTAYLSYYLPLNFLRASAVQTEAQRLDFFAGLSNLLDFGSGLGSGSLALEQIPHHLYVEQSTAAQELHRELKNELHKSGPQAAGPSTAWERTPPSHLRKQSLVIFSYSLTELSALPAWALEAEALMILEPATQTDGRQLMELRTRLIEQGYWIWAPCTHHLSCPLLTQSKTDWCHDRIHFQQPLWFQKMEEQLPIKNRTLTTSYLLARKQKPPALSPHLGRTVGDQVQEKGKTRQLLCQGPEREFLSWLEREWKDQVPLVPRGSLLDLTDFQESKKSNEIRITRKKT